ncbi:transposable element Tc1 transposase [Trichonephila clavipes]|uniref:Transposable element Tc1 transposase n=1 Tax=Trichonephila clavipes TaxID=2585209 RepID=A0A8X6SVA5_TRICX|nr:transposable element Tc1 transposase [Trichonephila clavipes]
MANRVSKIHQLSFRDQWHHIASEQNPADMLSGGLLPEELRDSMIFFHNCRSKVKKRGPLTTSEVNDAETWFIKQDQSGINFSDPSDQNLAAYFTEEGIQWNFIPPRAPHMGGLWEAGIKSVKYHLKRALGRSRLTYEEFETLIIQVEGILNSRPLTLISNDFDNFEVVWKMEYRLSEYSPTERKVDDREGQCNVYNGNCKGGFYTSLQLALGRVVEVYHGSDGKSLGNIAKVVGRSVNCIQKSCKNLKTGILPNNEGRGRKKIINSITERRVIHQVKIDPKISTPKIAASTSNTLGRSVSAETVRRVLRKAGYNGRVARKKPLIGKRNRVKRLKFAKEHILKPQQFWNEVIFSDESKFNIFGSDGRRMVWRKPNTSHHPKHTIPTVKHGAGSVMVWGCMAASGVGKPVFIDGIMHKMAYLNILQNNLKESADNLGLE